MLTTPRKRDQSSTGITGRDNYIICKALAYAANAIGRLPARWQERSDRADMVRLLEALTNNTDHFHLGARSHLECRGLKIVGDQLVLGERKSTVVSLAARGDEGVQS